MIHFNILQPANPGSSLLMDDAALPACFEVLRAIVPKHFATFDCFQGTWTKTPVWRPNAAECPKKHKPKAFFDIVANTQELVAKATTCPPGARCHNLFAAMRLCHFCFFLGGSIVYCDKLPIRIMESSVHHPALLIQSNLIGAEHYFLLNDAELIPVSE